MSEIEDSATKNEAVGSSSPVENGSNSAPAVALASKEEEPSSQVVVSPECENRVKRNEKHTSMEDVDKTTVATDVGKDANVQNAIDEPEKGTAAAAQEEVKIVDGRVDDTGNGPKEEEEEIEDKANEDQEASAKNDNDDGVDDDDDGESDSEAAGSRKQKASSALPPRPIKRARTAYFVFTDEKRPQVQAEHPGENVAFVARIMGQMWSRLSAEEKETYQQQAAQERDRVAKELEEWKAAGGVIEKETGGDGAGTKDASSLVFPLGRIRKICKLDPEVRGVSKEALLLITKCAEMATSKLGQESVHVAQLQNRRKLLPDDVAHVCSHREQFLFLKDDVKDLVKDMVSKQEPKTSGTARKGDIAREAAAAGSKSLTSYFGAANRK